MKITFDRKVDEWKLILIETFCYHLILKKATPKFIKSEFIQIIPKMYVIVEWDRVNHYQI